MTKLVPNEILPSKANDILQKNASAILVDIRSSMEYLFVGHPKEAVNIAWIDEPDWVINPNFSAEIRKLMLGGASHQDGGDCVPIILICRSGKRSMEAGVSLLEDGLTNIYSISTGFEGDLDDDHQRSALNGWRHDGLPWAQC